MKCHGIGSMCDSHQEKSQDSTLVSFFLRTSAKTPQPKAWTGTIWRARDRNRARTEKI